MDVALKDTTDKHFPSVPHDFILLRVTRATCNPNLHVVITRASHVCSQHSFRLPLRIYGMHRTHFDHARLDLLSLVI